MLFYAGSLEVVCVMKEIVEHLNVSVGFYITRTELPNLKV